MYYIYRITNKINQKTYIGQHKYIDINDKYMGSGKLLRKAQKKYGMNNFIKEILYSEIKTRKEADLLEIKEIANERKKGKAEYNITSGGEGFSGTHHTEETKHKLKLAFMGNQYAKGVNIGNQYAKGNKLSEKTKQKMSITRKRKHK